MWQNWKKPLLWGVSLALVHLLVLWAWMIAGWLLLGQHYIPYVDYFNAENPIAFHHDATESIPSLTSPVREVVFGVWRRWDALHYLYLAEFGLADAHIKTTAFPLGMPWLTRAVVWLLPVGYDLASILVSTSALAITLAGLYRIGTDYFHDERLARHALIVLCLYPVSFFLHAPMADSLYLAAAVLTFLAAVHRRWFWAGVAAAIAALTRLQGVVLLAVVGSFLFVEWWRNGRHWTWSTVQPYLWRISPMFISILIYIGYGIYRESLLGLPAVTDIHDTYWNAQFMLSWVAVWENYQRLWEEPASWFTGWHNGFLAILPLIVIYGLRQERFRSLPLWAYNGVHLGLFLTLVHQIDEGVFYGYSIGRYSLALFPFYFILADWLLKRGWLVRNSVYACMGVLLLLFTLMHAVGLGQP